MILIRARGRNESIGQMSLVTSVVRGVRDEGGYDAFIHDNYY